MLRTLGKWAVGLFVGILGIPLNWGIEFFSKLRSREGYVLFFTIIGAYVALYAIFVSQHERQLNRALFERQAFLSMVSSNNREMIITAMKNFGPIQSIEVRQEPSLFKPWTWLPWNYLKPNESPLYLWAQTFLNQCEPGTCGYTKPRSGDSYRIDLRLANLEGANLGMNWVLRANLNGADLLWAKLSKANLQRAMLRGALMGSVDLQGANLRWADLREACMGLATLVDTDLFEADLRKSSLRSADLKRANVTKADLRGADLCWARNLANDQIKSAKTNGETLLPGNPQCVIERRCPHAP
ncbi:MAG: pentapeptide repeat-containing protein [Candidatus Tectomicrobia bacterium]|nr:pentapeptide repeat-containing protein [Candidatus Tectomicrobia bacterium]